VILIGAIACALALMLWAGPLAAILTGTWPLALFVERLFHTEPVPSPYPWRAGMTLPGPDKKRSQAMTERLVLRGVLYILAAFALFFAIMTTFDRYRTRDSTYRIIDTVATCTAWTMATMCIGFLACSASLDSHGGETG
jgi:hypothetical protein